MSSLTVECPHCHQPFELTEAIAAPIVEAEREKALAEAQRQLAADRTAIEAKAKKDAEAKYADELKASQAVVAASKVREQAARAAELEALKAQEAAEQAKRDTELTVQREIAVRRAAIERQAVEKAQHDAAAELKAAREALAAKDEKLQQAQAAELEARRLKAEAEEAQRQTELTVARRMDDERAKVREQSQRESSEAYRLQLAEKDATMRAMQDQIEELRRKGNSGSQQLAGEVLELDLVEVLQQAFPGDQFDRVGKGQRGGDVVHTVRTPSGIASGRILWESKRTKTWQEGWLPKLRDDQRAAKCDLAALMTETLPSGVTHFEQVDGVWVTGLATVVPLASALRHALVEVSIARRAIAGADSKKDLVYGYLTGQEFRARVRGLIEPIVDMRDDLEREKRLFTKQWSVREKQLERCSLSLTGLYGDLHGIVGTTLPQVEGLTLPELTADGPADIARLEHDNSGSPTDEVH